MHATAEVSKLYTISELSKLIRQPRQRIAYAASLYEIPPARRAGTVKLFSSDQVQQILSACRRVASRGGAM